MRVTIIILIIVLFIVLMVAFIFGMMKVAGNGTDEEKFLDDVEQENYLSKWRERHYHGRNARK